MNLIILIVSYMSKQLKQLKNTISLSAAWDNVTVYDNVFFLCGLLMYKVYLNILGWV